MKKVDVLFFGLILMVALIIISGCAKTAAPREEILDTLIIDRSCPADNESLDSCCESKCAKYCDENERLMFKTELNIKEPIRHCLCWCS